MIRGNASSHLQGRLQEVPPGHEDDQERDLCELLQYIEPAGQTDFGNGAKNMAIPAWVIYMTNKAPFNI